MSEKLYIFIWLENAIETGTKVFLIKGRKIKENGTMLNKAFINYSHGEVSFGT